MTKPEVADPVNKLQRNFIKINNMKKLSKLHLRSEQYLTDSEMKLISGGADDDNKYCPYKSEATSTDVCHPMKRCLKKNYIEGSGGAYTQSVGICKDKFLGEGKWSCECS